MKSKYAKVSGKVNNNNIDDSDNIDTDDSEGNDLEAYDGFTGGFRLSPSTSITPA